MISLLCNLLWLYLGAIFGRIILSWFPMEPGSVLARVYSFVFTITEPVLGPLRRAIPPVGGGSMRIDLSPLIVLIVIRIIQSAVLGC